MQAIDIIPLIVEIGIFLWFVFSIVNMRDEIRNIIVNQRKIMKHLGLDYEKVKYSIGKKQD